MPRDFTCLPYRGQIQGLPQRGGGAVHQRLTAGRFLAPLRPDMLRLQLVFGLTAALLPFASLVSPIVLNARQIQWPDLPNNLTQDVLNVANAISPPCLNNTYCQQLTTVVIPRCERLRGDPGCWCGNHDPLHYCAICMSNPTDNQTTADQTEAATAGHNAFHVACNAYEELINGTAPTSTSSSPVPDTSTSAASTSTAVGSVAGGESKAPVGPIVGGVVGGVVGLALVIGAIWLISITLRRSDRRNNVRSSSVSHLSGDFKNPATFHAPYPQLTSYPAHISQPVSTYMHNPEPMVITPDSSNQAPVRPVQN